MRHIQMNLEALEEDALNTLERVEFLKSVTETDDIAETRAREAEKIRWLGARFRVLEKDVKWLIALHMAYFTWPWWRQMWFPNLLHLEARKIWRRLKNVRALIDEARSKLPPAFGPH